MRGLQEYKCPACGGALEFNSSLQKMKCPYCDSEFDVSILEELDAELAHEGADEMNWEQPSSQGWYAGETDGLRSYICSSCGGEIVGDENMAATSCPFCGNPVVIMKQFSGSLRPDFLIPFKLDKNAAKEGLKKHLADKKLLPKLFKDENHIDEIKGIYVPFWLFDADVGAHFRYQGTRIRHWSDSRYNYTETSYYSLIRDGCVSFGHVPVDGSSKLPDDLMESIEPYNLNDAVDFQTAYLAGYLADKYDLDSNASIARANTRICASTEQAFAATTTGYAAVIPQGRKLRLDNSKTRYALYPVWLLNTTYKGKRYTFAMNGQTGKFVGDLPVDKGAYWKYFGIFAAVFSVAVYLVSWLVAG